MPTTVEEATENDTKNGNHVWWDAIDKDMMIVCIAFEIISKGEKICPRWNKVSGNLVLDVKIYFTIKGRWVLDGRKTPYTIGSIYAGVVSRESVRISFAYESLKGANVFAADISN